MSETTARIRWEAGAELSMSAWQGLVGDLFLFQVIRPVFRGDQHTLTSNLPGQHQWKLDGDPEALKKGAEAWLEKFTSSLGAVFPDEDDAVFDERPTGAAFEALYAPGRRVRFEHPGGGWEGDQQMAAALLTPGEVYTIAWSDVGFSKTRLGLAGVESHGQGFNSVLFEPVDDDPAPSVPGGAGEPNSDRTET